MRTMTDDVPEDVKKARLQKMIDVFMEAQYQRSQMEIGKVHLVLVDGAGKKTSQLKGKTDTYRTVIFETGENSEYKTVSGSEISSSGLIIPTYQDSNSKITKGDYVLVEITGSTSNTLFGKAVAKSTFNGFFKLSHDLPFISADRLIKAPLTTLDSIHDALSSSPARNVHLGPLSL